jgi:hypothetical protein
VCLISKSGQSRAAARGQWLSVIELPMTYGNSRPKAAGSMGFDIMMFRMDIDPKSLVLLALTGLLLIPPSVHSQTVAATQGDSLISLSAPLGMSFRTSDSVRTECHNNLLKGNDLGCAEMDRELVIMANERRDEVWAKRTERTFREWIESNGSDYTIRSLECRRTLCAVEISSTTTGETAKAWSYAFWRKANLLPAFGGRSPKIFGFEKDAEGAKVVVGVYLFQRRP